MTAPTPGAEHDDKIAEALYDAEFGDGSWDELVASARAHSLSSPTATQRRYLNRVAELRLQLADASLAITPTAPTTGGGYAGGMRKAAEIVRDAAAHHEACVDGSLSGRHRIAANDLNGIADAILASTPSPQASDGLEISYPAWIIVFDDDSRENETFVGYGATEAARKRFGQLTTNWNVHLFKQVDGPSDSFRPVPSAPSPTSARVGKEAPAQTGAGLAEELVAFITELMGDEERSEFHRGWNSCSKMMIAAIRLSPRFAALRASEAHGEAVEAEREACAKIAEDEEGHFTWAGTDKGAAIRQEVAREIAAAIRARAVLAKLDANQGAEGE